MSDCPHCGRSMPLMFKGVPLTPLKFSMLERIKHRDGVPWQELGSNLHTVKAHIWQINELIEDTGWKIVGCTGYGYVLRKLNSYDADKDFAGSINDCYRAVRERKAAGGKGWPE